MGAMGGMSLIAFSIQASTVNCTVMTSLGHSCCSEEETGVKTIVLGPVDKTEKIVELSN